MAVKFPASTKASLHHRLLDRVEARWPQITQLHVRHRGAFTYVDADTTEDTHLKLCRLRFQTRMVSARALFFSGEHDQAVDMLLENARLTTNDWTGYTLTMIDLAQYVAVAAGGRYRARVLERLMAYPASPADKVTGSEINYDRPSPASARTRQTR